MRKKWYRRRRRLFEVLEVDNDLDYVSRGYGLLNAFTIVVHLMVGVHSDYCGVW